MKKHLFISFLLIITALISNETSAQVNKLLVGRTDTLIFKAGDYVIQPNDKLNDLLRRIPALTVDNKGKVFAQNEEIERVLVDGAEFFTEDISVAANVLRADKVDKIMIYWRWGDQSAFTGIDDKVKFKTINIIIKKEK